MNLHWHDIDFCTQRLAEKLEAATWHPDVIVGIGRGGLIPATLLSYKINVKNVYNLSIQTYTDENARASTVKYLQEPDSSIEVFKDKNVLIVDDLADTGFTFAIAKDRLVDHFGLNHVRTSSLCIKAQTSFVPDYYVTVFAKDEWINFPWD